MNNLKAFTPKDGSRPVDAQAWLQEKTSEAVAVIVLVQYSDGAFEGNTFGPFSKFSQGMAGFDLMCHARDSCKWEEK